MEALKFHLYLKLDCEITTQHSFSETLIRNDIEKIKYCIAFTHENIL